MRAEVPDWYEALHELANRPYEELIDQMRQAGVRVTLIMRGVDREVWSDLFAQQKSAAVFNEIIHLTSDNDVSRLLGAEPDDIHSDRTARALALAAYDRARRRPQGDTSRAGEHSQVVGIACLAPYGRASGGGDAALDRIHVAWQTASTTSHRSAGLSRDRRSSEAASQRVATLITKSMCEACDLAFPDNLGFVDADSSKTRRFDVPTHWRDLYHGAVACASGRKDGQHHHADEASFHDALIFPGAFNPLHEAHRRIATIATQTLGKPAHFELSIRNVDKPHLDFLEIADRAAQFEEREPLWLTRAATFAEKANIFSGATFLAGADTIARLCDLRYYAGNPQTMDRAIESIRSAGCQFLVFGRVGGKGFQSLGDIELPKRLMEICQGVPEEQFREDISSTALRSRRE